MTKVVATHEGGDKFGENWKFKYNEYSQKYPDEYSTDKQDSWLTEQKYYMSSKVVKWINVRPFAGSKVTTMGQGQGQGHPDDRDMYSGKENFTCLLFICLSPKVMWQKCTSKKEG